jgi:Cu-processing system ATP-binding protein
MKNGRIHAAGTVQSLREASGLPLQFELRLADGAEGRVLGAAATVGAGEVRFEGNRATLHCDRGTKMPLLQALSALGGAVTDLQMREPSLEDVLLASAA